MSTKARHLKDGTTLFTWSHRNNTHNGSTMHFSARAERCVDGAQFVGRASFSTSELGYEPRVKAMEAEAISSMARVIHVPR